MSFNLITDLSSKPTVSFNDRGLHYGDGLFETLLLHRGEIRYWQQHYERMMSSCKKLLIPCPEQSWLEQQLQDYLKLKQSLIIKIIVTRGNGGRGLSVPDSAQPNIYIFKYPFNFDKYNQPVKVTISGVTLSKNPILAGIKHLNRLEYVLATVRLQEQKVYDEAVLVDTDGLLIESIVHNLFFIHDDVVYTPGLSNAGVDGVMRQVILKSLKALGKQAKIGCYTLGDLLKADECFLCNSVYGIRPVTLVQHQEFEIGPTTQLLQRSIHGL